MTARGSDDAFRSQADRAGATTQRAQWGTIRPTKPGMGAIFTVWVDASARYVLAPKELPLGVMTAAVGGLFLIIVLKRRVRP
jgi:ABC-type enterobactin transport system permease subunit